MLFNDETLDRTEIDKIARDRLERQAHRVAPAPSPKDIAQDAQIRALQAENKELKIYLAQLVRTMVDHDLVTKDDVKELVENVTKVEQEMGLRLIGPPP